MNYITAYKVFKSYLDKRIDTFLDGYKYHKLSKKDVLNIVLTNFITSKNDIKDVAIKHKKKIVRILLG